MLVMALLETKCDQREAAGLENLADVMVGGKRRNSIPGVSRVQQSFDGQSGVPKRDNKKCQVAWRPGDFPCTASHSQFSAAMSEPEEASRPFLRCVMGSKGWSSIDGRRLVHVAAGGTCL